jgi:hypothetical protein
MTLIHELVCHLASELFGSLFKLSFHEFLHLIRSKPRFNDCKATAYTDLLTTILDSLELLEDL